MAKYLGDASVNWPNIRIHFNVLCIVFGILNLSSYLVFEYYNYSFCIKPFLLMKGLLPPSECGIVKEEHIRKMVFRSNLVVKF